MRGLACLAAVAVLASCAPASRVPVVADAPVPVAAEMRSWGTIVFLWQVSPSGEVQHTSAERPAGQQSMFAYWAVTRRAQVGPEGYVKIRAMFDPVARLRPGAWKCGPGYTDGPYGMVRWGSGARATASYRSDCTSRGATALMGALDPATKQVEAWTRDGEVISREWMGPPGEEPKR